MMQGDSTVVYIDVLIFVNTVIDYIILITSERLLKLRSPAWRIVLASFIGSLFSLLILVDHRSFFLTLLIKLLSTAAISSAAFRFHSFKELLKNALFTMLVSFIFSGLMIFIYQIFKPPNMLIVNDIVYFEIDPLVLIAVTVFIYAAVYICERIFRERIRSSVVRLGVSAGGKDIVCIAKIDTGCTLREPFSSYPVIIVDRSIMNVSEDERRRVIPYDTVAGSSVLYAVKADSVSIDGKHIDNEIYIASGDIRNNNYSAVINSDIIR